MINTFNTCQQALARDARLQGTPYNQNHLHTGGGCTDYEAANKMTQHTVNQGFAAAGFFFVALNPELWPLAFVGAAVFQTVANKINRA